VERLFPISLLQGGFFFVGGVGCGGGLLLGGGGGVGWGFVVWGGGGGVFFSLSCDRGEKRRGKKRGPHSYFRIPSGISIKGEGIDREGSLGFAATSIAPERKKEGREGGLHHRIKRYIFVPFCWEEKRKEKEKRRRERFSSGLAGPPRKGREGEH